MNYNKYLVVQNGTATTFAQKLSDGFSPVAGDRLSLNFTGLLDTLIGGPQEMTQFLPFDRSIYLNYTNLSYPITAESALDDPQRLQTRFIFSQLTKAGPVVIQGSGISSDGGFNFNFTVRPGPPSAAYTQVTNE